jgi:lysozyme family protein
LWGGKWMRVFQRRYAVEESWIREELAKPIPIVEEPPPTVVRDEPMNEAPAEVNGTKMGDDDGIE